MVQHIYNFQVKDEPNSQWVLCELGYQDQVGNEIKYLHILLAESGRPGYTWMMEG